MSFIVLVHFKIDKMKLIQITLDVLFPKYCLICDMILYGSEKFMCLKCESEVPLAKFKLGTNNPVEKTFWGRCQIETAGSYLIYRRRSKYAKLIKHIKYHDGTDLAQFLGKRYARWLTINYPELDGIDQIIPVPMHRRKLIKRGYNQAEEIAMGISEVIGKPINNDLIKRKRNKRSQTLLTRFFRWQNMKDLYQIGKLDSSLKHIAIVDDIITTGATIEACVREIHKYLNVKVTVLSLGFTV